MIEWQNSYETLFARVTEILLNTHWYCDKMRTKWSRGPARE